MAYFTRLFEKGFYPEDVARAIGCWILEWIKACAHLKVEKLVKRLDPRVLRLVYFEGCPNAPKIAEILRTIGKDFERIDQARLPTGDPFLKYASPTLLWNDQIVFGAKLEGAGGCSLSLPAIEEIKEKLDDINL